MSSAPALPEFSLSERFALILGGVCRTAAARLARNRAATPLLLLLWSRLQRAITRFARLAGKFDAGTLKSPGPASPGPARPQPARQNKPYKHLPNGYGWLAEWVPDTRVFGSQLQHLLTDPKMAALMEAAPQLGRLLRPLCRMLAVPPSPLLQRTAAKPARIPSSPRPEADPPSLPDAPLPPPRSTFDGP